MIIETEILEAHDHCNHNYKEIQESEICGCFYCLKTFPPSEIIEWLGLNFSKDSAVCPKCGIDSVLGSASGYPITHEFLGRMKKYWMSAHRVASNKGL